MLEFRVEINTDPFLLAIKRVNPSFNNDEGGLVLENTIDGLPEGPIYSVNTLFYPHFDPDSRLAYYYLKGALVTSDIERRNRSYDPNRIEVMKRCLEIDGLSLTQREGNPWQVYLHNPSIKTVSLSVDFGSPDPNHRGIDYEKILEWYKSGGPLTGFAEYMLCRRQFNKYIDIDILNQNYKSGSDFRDEATFTREIEFYGRALGD